jgi:heptosyltransferase-3
MKEIKKILIIKPRGIGDIILSTILLDSLHNFFSNAKIDYLTEHFAKPALENNPLINKVLTIGKNDLPFSVAFRLRKEKYDLIIDAWSNPRTALITFLSGAKYRAGFAYKVRKYAYNFLTSSDRGNHHSAEHNLELLKAINVPIKSKKIHYYVSDLEDKFGKEFISKNFDSKTVIGIVPSGGWPSKRCDASKWVEICNHLKSEIDCKFLIIWGPGDEADAGYIENHLPGLAVRAPETNIRTMAGLINNCNLIIANDSGPMHISAALGIHTLGIFGPTDPGKHGPYSENSAYVIKEDLFCIICNKLECPYNHECMLQLSNEKVLEAVKKLL